MALSLDEALGMSLADEADESIHVDVNTRQITIPESQRLFGVESDADVEVKHIVIDGRYADGNRDLSKLAWRVIYRNANKNTSYYLIPSVVANENSIEMDWLIKRSVVAYKGTVDFILCAFATTSSGEVTPEWNSTLGQGIVLEGLETSAIDINKEVVDELAKILYETIKARDAAAKSAADADSTANSINESMTQIAANKEAIGQLKDGKISKFYASSQGNTNLPDSDDGRIMDLKLYGKSEQKQYSGKNLLDLRSGSGGTGQGVTYTPNGDGSYTRKGTATGENGNVWFLGNYENTTTLFTLKAGTYTVKDCSVFSGHTNRSNTFTIAEDFPVTGVRNSIQIVGVSYNDVIYPRILAGSTDTGWEPYVGGIPSPNPEYPQEIKSVVKPVVKVMGKNLFDNINKSVDASGWTTTKIVYIPKGKYVYKRFVDASSNGKINTQLYALIDGLWKSISNDSTTSFDDGNITFIDGNWNMGWGTTSRVIFELKKGYYMRASNPSDEVHLMLVSGDTEPTEYEECKETTATLPYTLNAIPVTSGGNVTIDGQQYVADYVDVERGKLVKNVLTLNASDVAWELDRGWSGEGYYTYSTKSGFINQLYYNSRVASAISNAFIAKSRNDYANSLRNVIMLAGSEVYIEFIGTDKSTLQEWTNYIETNPVMIFAALKNPTETDLTADEIAAFKALVSYYPVTNVSTTSDQLDGYTVFNYPISLANGWNYVKQQLGDTRDYLYGIDLMTAEAYVNSEYAAALAEIEV